MPFICAPFLAKLVEAYLDLPEKPALIILSMSFIASIVGESVTKGLIAVALGMLTASIGTGEEFYPRLTAGWHPLATGFPVVGVVLGMLILGEVFKGIEDLMQERKATGGIGNVAESVDGRPSFAERVRLLPFIGNSAAIGTMIGALPGVGSTLAATLGYASGSRLQKRRGGEEFETGAPEWVAATEAANSAVSGANLIPVLSLGIPGNAAAVFLVLAMESIGGFNPGPAEFKLPSQGMNEEMGIAFGIFTAMAIANLLNWTIGGFFHEGDEDSDTDPEADIASLGAGYHHACHLCARSAARGHSIRLRLRPARLPVQAPGDFGASIHYRLHPGRDPGENRSPGLSATGGDPLFLFSSPISIVLMMLSLAVVVVIGTMRIRETQ